MLKTKEWVIIANNKNKNIHKRPIKENKKQT